MNKTFLRVPYLEILPEKGFSYKELPNEPDKHTFDLQLHVTEKNIPIIYNFTQSQDFLIIWVVKQPKKKLVPLVEHLAFDLDQEKYRLNNRDREPDEEKFYNFSCPEFQQIMFHFIIQNLGDFLLPGFIVPERITPAFDNCQDSDSVPDENIESEPLPSYPGLDQKLLDSIDGMWSIDDFVEELGLDLITVQVKFFILWINRTIYFHMRYTENTTFLRTAKSPMYLDEGSEEYISLVKKYDSNKIIRIVQLIDPEMHYGDLKRTLDITQTKLHAYLGELLRLQVIRRKPFIPKFPPLTEDIIPILTLQGFKKQDLEILKQVEEVFNEKKVIGEIALELLISPKKIKQVVQKYQDIVKTL